MLILILLLLQVCHFTCHFNVRLGSMLPRVVWTSKHRRWCLVESWIICRLAFYRLLLIMSWHFSDFIFRGICLFPDWWIWCQICLIGHHLHVLSTLEVSRTMMESISINKIRRLLNILGKQFGIDFAYRNLGRSTIVIFDWRHLLPWRNISLWLEPDNFRQRLNCFVSNLGEWNYFLFHAISILKTLLCSNWVT